MDTLRLSEILAKAWIKAFKKMPAVTSISSLVGIIVAITGIIYSENSHRKIQEAERAKNQNYAVQLQKLNETEKNIRLLLDFIDSQKSSLAQTQDTINSLKAEHEKLRPIVDADKNIVQALLSAQEDRNKSKVWTERWIGFGFGIVASLFASVIYAIVTKLATKKSQ